MAVVVGDQKPDAGRNLMPLPSHTFGAGRRQSSDRFSTTRADSFVQIAGLMCWLSFFYRFGTLVERMPVVPKIRHWVGARVATTCTSFVQAPPPPTERCQITAA